MLKKVIRSLAPPACAVTSDDERFFLMRCSLDLETTIALIRRLEPMSVGSDL